MTTTDAHKRMQERINATHANLDLALTGAWPYPPTEPRDQEHDMMNDRDRRAEAEFYFDEAESVESHKESVALSSAGALSALLAIHDLLDERLPRPGIDLTPQEFTDFLAAAKGEPVDVTEEPPCGSQVTDKDGDIWQRTNVGWRPWLEMGKWASGTRYQWFVIRKYAPLRLTTDAERVGIDTAPDVDPDEALNRAVAEAIDDVSPPPPAPWDADWLDRATAAAIRAAREHIEQEIPEELDKIGITWQSRARRMGKRAEKAEAEVLRLQGLSLGDLRRKVQAEAERDEWKARHLALRADVERVRRNRTTLTDVLMCIADVLDRDDERGQADRGLFGGSGAIANAIERGCGEDFRRRFVDPAPDTVTLRREDVEGLLFHWDRETDRTASDEGITARVRAALGWGDGSE